MIVAVRAVLGLSAAVAVSVSGCTAGPTVVNTGEPPPTAASNGAPGPVTTRPSNAHLANAFDYAVEVDGATAYYFTSPSGRWQCAIIPRTEAGCQNATTPAIGIAGAPDDVPGTDGEAQAPTAIRVTRDVAPEFVVAPATAYGLRPDAAKKLPFNRILAVAGFRCNVQESAGISCMSESSGQGFTFSVDGYTLRYTDVPGDAP